MRPRPQADPPGGAGRRAGRRRTRRPCRRPSPGIPRRASLLGAEHPLIRRLTGLAAVDSDIERAVADVQQHRLPLLTSLMERLGVTGHLSPALPPGRALDVLWMLSSFEAFDQLFAGRRLPVGDVAEILADVAVGVLLVGEDPARAVPWSR